ALLVLPFRPVTSHNTLYRGTMANAKANMPATVSTSFLMIPRFRWSRFSLMAPLLLANLLQRYFTTGGVSKVWNGAGDGTVHSRPSGFSHTSAVAFSPFFRKQALISTHSRNSCEIPNQKPPMLIQKL